MSRLLTAVFVPLAAWCVTASAQPVAIPPELEDAQILLQEQRYDDAIDMLSRLTEQEPEDGAAWFFYGYALHSKGELEKAIPIHEKAASLTEGQLKATALYNIACAQARLGEPDKALDALERAFAAGFATPQNLRYMRTDSDMDTIRGNERYTALVNGTIRAAMPEAQHRLDFWIGEWDVYGRDGTKLGENSIGLRDGAWVIDESWTGSGGDRGRSVNYYDPVEKVRKQVWVSGGSVLEMAGRFEDGAMRFKGVDKYRSGTTAEHRTTLTPLEEGRVRQFIEESTDGGETWNVKFDGVYVPRGESPPESWEDDK